MQSLFAQFQTRYPAGGLITELLTIHDGNYVVRALVNVGDRAISTGIAAAPTVEAAEDQARLRALQVFNQLSNPVSNPVQVGNALQSSFVPVGLPTQPQSNVAATPVSSNLTTGAIATHTPPSVPPSVPVNGSTGTAAPPVASPSLTQGLPQTVAASAAAPVPSSPQPVSQNQSTEPSAAPPAPTSETSNWSVDLSAVPDSTLPTNFSITSVPNRSSTKPVADLYAAATEADADQSWDTSSNLNQDSKLPSDLETAGNQAIPFFDDDPLEPEFPAEAFTSSMDDEAAAAPAAKSTSTKSKPAKSAKATKSQPDPTPVSPDPTAQVVDRSDEIAQIDVEMRRLGWTKQQGRKHLEQTYNKRSRQQLTDDELLAFLAYLQAQPSPSQSPF